MPPVSHPDRRTAREREQDRQRAIVCDRRLAAEEAALRKAELERLERLQAATTQTPETRPDLFRRIEMNVHVEYLAGDLDLMMRTMKRIVDARRIAKEEGDAQAFREAEEEGAFLTEILKRYLIIQMDEEERRGGSGNFDETRKVVRNAARKNALRRLREAS